MKTLLVITMALLCTGAIHAQSHIDLGGEWKLTLQHTAPRDLRPATAHLPGTTDQAKAGTPTSGSDFGILTRTHKYCGTAIWERQVTIPETWRGKYLSLDLERVMWESRLKVDGTPIIDIERQDALSTPHRHIIAPLTPGTHTLTLEINNDTIYNIGDKGHAYGEYTQTIWNGAVGDLRLTPLEPLRMDNPQIFTAVSPDQTCSMKLIDTLINERGKCAFTIQYSLYDLEDNHTPHLARQELWSTTQTIKATGGKIPISLESVMPVGVKPWSDTSPNLYNLNVTLLDRKGATIDNRIIEIGFREITTSDSKILVNGRPVFMRGNLDCVHFPITGYPSCEVKDWERIFRIYKDYGLNHVRFHSWCPPQAAFTAANRIGIYIQAEAIWIDWWMGTPPTDRPEMYTKGLPKGLGHNPSADSFVPRELERMVKHYGNNPSFIMMCIGNELGNSDFDTMARWIEPIKARDNRRLYSLSAARRITPTDQYMVTHHVDGIGATRGLAGGASTNWDFEANYSRMKIPTIAHEIGQWPVYPRWSEINKYTGVVRARNFDEFRTIARTNHIEEQNEEFTASSGALNQIMYKYEIESFLRTPSCAGIQLLSMQDYQGQGEALIGWLDSHWDSKGITSPERFRNHHDTLVPLLRIDKFVWSADETLSAKIQLANHGTATLNDSLHWQIRDSQSRTIANGIVAAHGIEIASSPIIDSISVNLSSITKADKLTIELRLKSRPIHNSWNVWVYPTAENSGAKNPTAERSGAERFDDESSDAENFGDGIFITDRFDAECRDRLNAGERVLLLASGLGREGSYDAISFFPLYWSLTFFPGQGINTIGMLLRNSHPALLHFPTDSHSDWQWQSIYKGARGFIINNFPADFRPIAQPIDDFHRNNKLGAIMEMSVGKGRLMVCGFDISDTASDRSPAAEQLRSSLLHYMQSEEFQPTHTIPADTLAELFASKAKLEDGMPSEFNSALLYIECAKQVTDLEQPKPWSQESDKAISRRATTYKVECDGTWADQTSEAWHGRNISLEIDCPQGMIGSLYLFFHDWSNQARTGTVRFEGRDYELGPHDGQGRWVKLHVMREDSNDGKLRMNATVKQGGNLMLSRVALVQE